MACSGVSLQMGGITPVASAVKKNMTFKNWLDLIEEAARRI